MRHEFTLLSLLFSSALFAQTPPMNASAPAEAEEMVTCEELWQETQTLVTQGRQLAESQRVQEADEIFAEARPWLEQIVEECPSLSRQAATLMQQITPGRQQTERHQRSSPACQASLDAAFTADVQVSTARRENQDLQTMDKLLTEAENAWQSASTTCSATYKERAERSLRAARKARAENAGMLSGGPACDQVWKNAIAIHDLAKDARKAKRWDEAAMLYGKAHMAWERVTENCGGNRQQTAAQRLESAMVDAHNAEYCDPQWDDASDLLNQLNKAKANGTPLAERQQLLVKAEVLWREAVQRCRGEPLSQATTTVEAIARERGTPLPANAMKQYGKHRALPDSASPPPQATPQVASPRPTAAAPASPPPPPADLAPPPPRTNTASTAEASVTVAGDTTYRGNFKNIDSKMSGEGVVEWGNGDHFRGTLVNGLRHGKGRFTWKNGQWYEGDWKNDQATGHGTIAFTNGNRYEGSVVAGVPQGQGMVLFPSGDRYTGNFEQGIFHGRGTYQWKNGAIYTGDWVHDQKHGHGHMTLPDGSGWEGEYRNDQPTDQVQHFKAP